MGEINTDPPSGDGCAPWIGFILGIIVIGIFVFALLSKSPN